MGLAIIVKVIGAYIMLCPELAQTEIEYFKKHFNL